MVELLGKGRTRSMLADAGGLVDGLEAARVLRYGIDHVALENMTG